LSKRANIGRNSVETRVNSSKFNEIVMRGEIIIVNRIKYSKYSSNFDKIYKRGEASLRIKLDTRFICASNPPARTPPT